MDKFRRCAKILLLLLLVTAALTPAVSADGITLGVVKEKQVNFGNILWRVLYNGTGDDKLEVTTPGQALLISNNILDVTRFNQNTSDGNAWSGSRAQGWCNNFYANWTNDTNKTAVEKDAILPTSVEETNNADGYYYKGGHSGSYYYGAAPLSNAYFFFLSAEEADKLFTDDKDRKASGAGESYWWLRSPYVINANIAAEVDTIGEVHINNVDDIDGARPAFNLNLASVIFSSGISSESSNQYKLTLMKDDALIVSLQSGETPTMQGSTVTIPYIISGADAGNATRLLVLITNKTFDSESAGWESGAVIQKSTIKSTPGTFGTVSLDLGDLSTDKWGTDYHVYLIAEDENDGNLTNYGSAPLEITIPKLDQTVTAPSAKDLTYTGSAQDLITKGTAANGTMKYAVTTEDTMPAESAYTYTDSSLPTGTDAKTYYVWYMSTGNEGYNDYVGQSSVSVKIAPADPETPTGLSATYGDNLAAVTLPSGWAWADSSASVGNVGTKSFKANYTSPDTNHNSKQGVDVSVAVNQKPVTVKADDQNKLEGDPDPVEFTATVTDSQGQELASDIVTYSFTREGDESVGSHTIKVTGEVSQGNYTVTFVNGTLTISAKDAAPITTAPEAAAGWTEDGASHALLKTAGASDGGTFYYQVNDGGWSSDVPTAVAAGEYKIYYYIKGTGIYKDNGSESAPLGPLTVTVSEKGTPKLTTQPEGASRLEANGSMQDLLKTAGSADGGTVMYSVNGGAWSDEVPQASEAGEYKVSYYIKGDSTHTDSGTPENPLGTISVVIAEEPMDLDVNFVFLTGSGSRGVPFDVKDMSLKPSISIKDGDDIVSKSGSVTLEVTAGEKEKTETVTFSKKLKDLAPGKYSVSVSGLPKTVDPHYKFSAKAEINEQNGNTVITVYLIFKDQSAPEEPVVYILPEDEIGAYALNADGTKMYLLFHTYDICMAWLGRDDLCSGYERCFHKDGK